MPMEEWNQFLSYFERVGSERTSRLCLKNVVDKVNSCVVCHVECGGKCCLRSADAVFCGRLWRYAGDSTLLCMTDHEEVIGSLDIMENAQRRRQEVGVTATTFAGETRMAWILGEKMTSVLSRDM